MFLMLLLLLLVLLAASTAENFCFMVRSLVCTHKHTHTPNAHKMRALTLTAVHEYVRIDNEILLFEILFVGNFHQVLRSIFELWVNNWALLAHIHTLLEDKLERCSKKKSEREFMLFAIMPYTQRTFNSIKITFKESTLN